MNISETIKNTPLFHSEDMDTIERLAKNCHQKHFAKGRGIFDMGDSAEHFFIILKGWIKLYRVSKEGEEVIIHVFGPGESFAEAAVFNDTKSYPVSAQAVEDVTLIEIPRTYFIKKIEEDTRFALRMLGAISSRQHYLVEQIEQVSSRSAPQRVGAFLLRFCQREKMDSKGEWVVYLPYDKSIISSRLNIKPETFSRALLKLEPYGVALERGKIIVSDIESLKDFCDISSHGWVS